jgi:hypothetical protein
MLGGEPVVSEQKPEVEDIKILAMISTAEAVPENIRWIEIPLDRLHVGRPGLWLIRIKTSKLTPEKAGVAVARLAEELQRLGVKPISIMATEDTIDVLFRGSPFPWLVILATIANLLPLIGITILAISVYQGVTSIPSWVWGLAVVGLGLALFGPAVGDMILSAIHETRRLYRRWHRREKA